MKYKLYTVLSEQHAFDCEPLGSCSKGGVPHHVFEYVLLLQLYASYYLLYATIYTTLIMFFNFFYYNASNNFTNYRHLGKKGGLMQLIHYPAAPDSRKHVCQTNPDKIFVRFNRYARFDIENERILAAAVDTMGPLCASEIEFISIKNYRPEL